MRKAFTVLLLLAMLVPVFSIAEETIDVTANEEEIETTVEIIDALRRRMKDPDSFRLYDSVVYLGEYDGEIHLMADVGAKNGFGGMNRNNYYIVHNVESGSNTFLDMDDKDNAKELVKHLEKVQVRLEKAVEDSSANTMKSVDKDIIIKRLQLEK